MHPRQPVPPALRGLAELQAGVISREQALGVGFSRSGLSRLVADGSWQRTATGIYLTVPGPPSWSAQAWAGVLIGGDDARIGGLAAAHLHELHPDEPIPIEVLVPDRSRPRVEGPWLFRRERPGTRRYPTVGAPPRLSIEETVLDLVNDPDCDARSAINWITLAVGARKTTPERILRAAGHRRLLRQRALLRDILDDVRIGVRSPIEHDYLHKVERPHGLPAGRRQAGRRRTEVDVLYEDFGVIVELDGLLGHTGLGRFRDMRRDNWATTDGLATLRYGKADVFGIPCDVAQEVGINLMRRGWAGPLSRCPLCRRAA
jgi:hypothetical protein